MKKLEFVLIGLIVFACGCYKHNESRVILREDVGSDTARSNIITEPIQHAFSAVIGEGIEVTKAVTRRNDAGFLEIYVDGRNASYNTKRFRYKVEWLDADGIMIETKTSVWLPKSAMGKSPSTIKAVAPRVQAVNFRMDTRTWE